jgi:hypothetical protein
MKGAVSFCCKNKTDLATFFMSIEKFYLVQKKTRFFLKNIRGFVNSGLVKKCHEHVKKQENRKPRQKLLK